MQISKYGITLKSLEAADLEMVRNWRNAGHVRPYMQYQTVITPAMQQAWFDGLDFNANLYFIIQQGEKQVGIVNLKDIDNDLRTAEAGIFIGEQAYLNSMLPVLATISIMEFAFDGLKLATLKAKIGDQNKKVILFNESIGYRKNSQQDDGAFHYYTVNHADFLSATKRLRETLDKLK